MPITFPKVKVKIIKLLVLSNQQSKPPKYQFNVKKDKENLQTVIIESCNQQISAIFEGTIKSTLLKQLIDH